MKVLHSDTVVESITWAKIFHFIQHNIMKYIECYKEALDFRPWIATHFTFWNSTSSQTGYSMRKENEGWCLIFPPIGNWLVHEKCSLYDRWLEARGWRITRVSWCQPKEKWFQRTLWETFVFFVLLHTDAESFPLRPAMCLKNVNSFYAMQLKYRNWPVIYNWLIFHFTNYSCRVRFSQCIASS